MSRLPKDESKTDNFNLHPRRHFLRTSWLMSIILMQPSLCGLLALLASESTNQPSPDSYIFSIDPATLPKPGDAPLYHVEGRFWIVITQTGSEPGMIALSRVCTHLGCFYKWLASQNQFVCPCHGAKFTPNGTVLAGPAPRNLDHYRVTVTTKDGNVLNTDKLGSPISIANAATIQVNTAAPILGDPVPAHS